MQLPFTAKRFVQVFAIAFVVLTTVYMLRGQPARYAARDAGLWSLIAAAIFAGTAVYYRRANKPCKLCVEEAEPPMKKQS